ncbi:transposase is4 [Holotrichia oblita]|uniref:Transposase is4 n=1 Tax=Holotrichia oblita TaxID=644536 RepID=A0ACB9SL10_HOLOL|nr:transposase is4 [Holotrichia oblita]
MTTDFSAGSIPVTYREVYAICSHNDEPIHKDVYQKLLAQCKLSSDILRVIWNLVGPVEGTVTRTNLYKTLALVAWAQQGKKPSNKLFETFNGKAVRILDGTMQTKKELNTSWTVCDTNGSAVRTGAENDKDNGRGRVDILVEDVEDSMAVLLDDTLGSDSSDNSVITVVGDGVKDFHISRKRINSAKLQYFADNLSDISSGDELNNVYRASSSEPGPFHGSVESDGLYKPSEEDDEHNGEESAENCKKDITIEVSVDEPETASYNNVIWSLLTNTDVPRLNIPCDTQCVTDASIAKNSSTVETFNKFFPRSLFTFIADCTNQRIKQYNRDKRKSASLTYAGEVMITIECTLVMCYNKVPKLRHYWSSHRSLGNRMIKGAISKNR